ncbi:glycosyltransferase family 2 protein [Candidatus Pelagibacter sp.]|nr:glycosyltransferase family 2 protein [Candidatus Pelagibacter sp.]
MDLISVIIPYYRKKDYFLKTINSVLRQTYKNIEIIIIYDDEKKKELKLIKKIVSLDKRIHLIINKYSLGAGLSRNKGIKKSKGKYIGFIDADDLWKNNKLELQIKFMKKRNALISHTNYKIINKQNKVLNSRVAKDFNNVNELLKSCDIGLSSVVVKKEVLIGNCLFASLKTKEDFVLWLNILKKNIKILSLKKNLMYWRKLDNSLSSSILQKLFDGFRVYNNHMKFNWMKSLYFLFYLSLNFLRK